MQEALPGNWRSELLVVDDRPLFGFGMASVFEGMVGRVLTIAPEQATDVPIGTGIALVALRGLESVAAVGALTKRGRTVIAYGRRDSRCVLAAVEAGAVGFLRDTADAPTVRDAVAIARRGGRLEFPDADPQPAPDGFGLLTAREREVLAGLLDGLRPSDIAERHFVSVTTVRNQVQSILTKLNVSSQLEAVAAAHRTGWSLDAA